MERTYTFIGDIDEAESQAIEPIVERLAGLEELLMIDLQGDLIKKINVEMQEIKTCYAEWCNNTADRHNWSNKNYIYWQIDFQENKVWSMT